MILLHKFKFCVLLLVCLVLLPSCAGNHPGQSYADAPSSIVADDGVVSAGNFNIQPSQPFTVGFDILNQGSDAVTLDSITSVDTPSVVKVVGVAFSRPLENDKGLLQGGSYGFPPELSSLHRPWHFHSLKGAIVHPKEYAEAIISLMSPQKGAFLIKGFLLTMEIGGTTYQHYYHTTVFLCIKVDQTTCQQAADKANGQ